MNPVKRRPYVNKGVDILMKIPPFFQYVEWWKRPENDWDWKEMFGTVLDQDSINWTHPDWVFINNRDENTLIFHRLKIPC